MQTLPTSHRDLPMWRSLLFCPANAERFIAKAHTRGADAIILDLEDAVPAAEKQSARTAVAASAHAIHAGGPEVLVRINRELELAVADISAAVSADVTALVVPKVHGPEHIQLLAEVISAQEMRLGLRPDHTGLVALVESAGAVTRINEIAAAHPRLVGMAVGGEDLATDLDAEPTADSLYVAKMLGVHAARAAGILPLGIVASVANVQGDDAYRAMLARSRALGFAAATCVHPAQVPLLNEAFGPSASQLDRARRLVETYAAAQARGQGAVLFEGAMIDKPIVARAERLLARAGVDKAAN